MEEKGILQDLPEIGDRVVLVVIKALTQVDLAAVVEAFLEEALEDALMMQIRIPRELEGVVAVAMFLLSVKIRHTRRGRIAVTVTQELL